MTLSASALTSGQLCPRRFVLERSEPRGRWHPKSLFDATARQAILELSQGYPKEKVVLAALSRFRALARDPGLEAVDDPWTLAQDFCACLQTILEALSREGLPLLQVIPSYPLGGDLHWQSQAFIDASGSLGRWVFPERLDADSLARELHSWGTFGEMAVLEAPMVLHLVALGTQRDGRRHSPWCRIYADPGVHGHFRFRKKDGSPLGPGWKSQTFSEARLSPEDWVNYLERDGLLPKLLTHFDLKALSPAQASEGLVQIRSEASRLGSLPSDWRAVPMFRPACDFPYTCPWQFKCYGPSF